MSHSWAKFLSIAFLFLVYLMFLIGCNMQKELNSSEKSILSDIPRFNNIIKEDGWHKTGAIIHNMNLKGIALVNSSLNRADLKNVQFSGKIENTKFVGSKFEKTNFFDITLENVTFQDCDMEKVEFHNVKLLNVSFINCKANYNRFEKAKFDHVKFQKHTEENGGYLDLEINNSEFTQSQLKRVGFYNGEANSFSFTKSKLSEVNVQNIKTSKLNLSENTLNGFTLVKNTHNKPVFDGNNGVGLGLAGGIFNNPTIKNSTNLTQVEFNKSEVNDLRIENCKLLDTFFLTKSNINQMQITKTRLELSDFIESTLSGPVLVTNSDLVGIVFRESKMKNIIFQKVHFVDFLAIENTSFEMLRLKEVVYRQPFKLDTVSVKYTDSDRFTVPESARDE